MKEKVINILALIIMILMLSIILFSCKAGEVCPAYN